MQHLRILRSFADFAAQDDVTWWARRHTVNPSAYNSAMFRIRRSEFLERGRYFIAAYSEFMPPPRMFERAYGTRDDRHFRRGEWPVTEYEEALELRPGLASIGAQLVDALSHLGRGERAQGIDGRKLDGNP